MTAMWAAALLLLSAGERPETYVVQAGDTCQSVTARFWGKGAKVDELHRYNVLGPTPHTLVPGQVLRLREPDSKAPDATLTFLKPAVRARTSDTWEPAKLGMGLFRLDEVNTLKRAGAELTLRDASQLLLDENALVVIYGEPNAQKVSRGPAVIEGEVRLALTGARGIEMPGGGSVNTVKADGVVAVDGARTGRVSIFDGDVVVESAKVAVKLKKDEGTVVRSGAAPLPARPLPQPPQPQLAALVLTGRDDVASLDVKWPPVANAQRYRVQLANDEKFLDLAAVVSTIEPRATLGNVPPGHYRLRVIAFDAEGLQGRASVVQQTDVIRLGGGADASGVVSLRAGEAPAFSGPPGVSLQGGIVSLPVGRHSVQVLNGEGQIIAPVTISIRPSAPVVRDEKGALIIEFPTAIASAEGLSVKDSVGDVPLEKRGDRTFVSRRAVSGSTTVAWDGFDLVRFNR
ncbi:MAG: LysM peptidoglycan-binding domain-containing protein [Archangium sp.]